MPVVVSDTSPLRALAHLGYMDWLETLFHRVLLPPTVVFELAHPSDRAQLLLLCQPPPADS